LHVKRGVVAHARLPHGSFAGSRDDVQPVPEAQLADSKVWSGASNWFIIPRHFPPTRECPRNSTTRSNNDKQKAT
jgi:hypothetical protein